MTSGGAGSDEALKLARRLAALPEPQMRERVLLEYLGRTEPAAAAPVLAELQIRGRSGGPPFNVALRSLFGVLVQELLGYDELAALYAAAKQGGHEALMQLFYSGPDPTPHPSQPGPDPQRELTLGHRKSMARSRDPDVLVRLMADPEPPVIAQLLSNPRLTEDHVVRLAARRPALPDVQRLVSTSKWIRRYRVKRALVLNPHTPIDIGVRLLGLLDPCDLKLIRNSPALADQLRAAARRLARASKGAG